VRKTSRSAEPGSEQRSQGLVRSMCVHAWALEFDKHEGSSNTIPEILVPVDPRCAI